MKRKNVQAISKKECEQIKKEVIAYLDEFVNAIGDQADAIAYVKQYSNIGEK
ncbi:hypothetical protein [Fibrobacter sp. UWB1]|uniref:hypothetical protein n=1 Tax=Fibrobacter sp. UWB1 TaxID=1964355 RepID=UPI001483BB0E|nr:hypothetical protein [Fibrobacter sp. UWB1]